MSQKKRGLGKGLAALLDTDSNADTTEVQMRIDVELIDANPYQPRKAFDEVALTSLVKSIQQHGVIQPIAVRQKGERYELISGERRLRASKIAEKTDIPAVILDVSDRDSATFALIENLQREDLNVIEKATSIKALIEEFGLTHEQCADYLGQSRSGVSNLLRLLTLSEPVKNALQTHEIDMGHARALINLSASLQKDAMAEITSKDLSVRETERWVRQLGESRADAAPTKKRGQAHHYLASTLSSHLDAKVKIIANNDEGGKISIHFDDIHNLKNIISVIGIDWIEPN